MAEAQYTNVVAGVSRNRRFGAPSVATTAAWYKAARIAIPEIPNLKKDPTWTLANEPVVSVKWIRYDLVNKAGGKCYVIIDRTAPSM